MKGSLGEKDLRRLSAWVGGHLGLSLDEDRHHELAVVLERRLATTGRAAPVYLAQLESGPPPSEMRAWAEELAIGETCFFRNGDQFRALAEEVLPELLAERPPGMPLRVLSAGCSSGEEAYSLAIVLREAKLDARRASIRAVDVRPGALERARRGCYTRWSLRETPPDVRRSWFREQGGRVVVCDSLRDCVSFEERNLTADDPQLWQPGAYDVVFCRNVLMYFTRDQAIALVERIARSLQPGGFLFLGHAETLRGLSEDFVLCQGRGAFYYRRRDDPPRRAVDDHVAGRFRPLPPEPVPVDADASWFDAVSASTRRIQTVTQPVLAEPDAPTATTAPEDLHEVRELVAGERFDEALDLLHDLPASVVGDPEVVLLRAVLLARRGRFEAAERDCAELLRVGRGNAGTHYVLALCRESAGDFEGAASHDRIAASLDPSFALPHLHLGLLARRSGDGEAARRELGHSLFLLEREDSSRLLLFGGGFPRDALLALCRAELVAGGGTS